MSRMALNLSQLFTKRLKLNYSSLLISNENFLHTDKVTDLPGPPQSSKSHDILLHNIKNVHSSNELFNIISSHSQIFNHQHVIQTLSSLHDLHKADRLQLSTEELASNPSFERLCYQLKKYSRALDLNDTIKAIKVLTHLNISSNTTIFKMLLQLVRESINNLELRHIIFLDFLLKKCNKNHLIDSIQLALPLVFQLNVSTKMDRENIVELTQLLRYSATNKVPLKCVTSIVTSLLLNESEIDKDSAKSIIWSLCDLYTPVELHPIYAKLLTNCFNILKHNINKLSFDDILKTLKKLRDKIVFQHDGFYNTEFIDACGNYAIQQDIGFYNGIHVARILSRIAHNHLELLEYLSQLIVIDNEVLSKCRPFNIISYVSALSNANYKPRYWDQIEVQILANPILKSENRKLPWTKFVTQLAALDIYNDELLNKVFSKSFLKEYLSRDNNLLDQLQLLLLYQAVSVFYPSYSGEFPTNILDHVSEKNCSRSVDEMMKNSLEKALGGPQYFASQVQLPYGIFADFLIVFGEGQIPVAINLGMQDEGPINYKDLNINKNNELVCIMNFHKGCYSINCQRLRGNFEILLRMTEKIGFKVVPVSLMKWEEMPEMEKIPYIMREINYKLKQDTQIKIEDHIT